VMCAQAAVAMTAARLREESDQRLLRLQTLRNLDIALTASFNSQMTLSALVEQVRALPGVDATCVLTFQPGKRVLEFAAGNGFRARSIPRSQIGLGEGYAGRAALEQRTISVFDLKNETSDFVRMNLIQEEEFVLYHAIPMVANGQIKGALEVFGRTPRAFDGEHVEFLEAMATQTAVALEKVAVFESLQRSNLELTEAYDETLIRIAKALDLRDREPEGHTERVTEFTLRLARHLGVPEAELVHYRRGALLHDIGKMSIPDTVLLKSGPLSDDEWSVMKKHPSYAYELLSAIPLLRPALDIPYCHHERWDGTGYPCGLSGEQIPLSARIFALADAWDAMGVDRPYRAGWPLDKIRQHIVKNSGSHFDPNVVTAFEQMHF
jgi:HD-GYP domain-containing protein (c-di-GMP phosphodiesterase class II)